MKFTKNLSNKLHKKWAKSQPGLTFLAPFPSNEIK